MSLNFLNSHLLWLLALAAVPVLLHLFARTRPPAYEFSSVEFLRKIIRKTMRLKKPQDIILLILRTLAVMALIGAFLRPLLFSQEKLSGLFQKKNLVAIVDASASMGYVEGAQTRFATACAETSELLSGLSGRDRANIIWLKSEPESVFPDELGANLGYLKDQLRRASVTMERGAIDKAFTLATELLADTEGKREICVISDFQRSAWEGFEPELPEGVDLIHVKIGSTEAPNLAVTSLSLEPSRPVVGEELSLLVEVTNFSTTDRETTVFSEVGEGRRSQNLSLPAGGKTTATFRHALTRPGATPVKVSVTEDAFPGDDRRMLATLVRPYLRVAVVPGDDPDTAKLWARAAQALGWAVPEWTDPGVLTEESSGQFDAIFFAGSPPDLKIPSATKVVFQPPTGNMGNTPGFSPDGSPPAKVLRASNGKSPYQLRISDPDAALFDLFRGGENGSIAGISGGERMELTPLPSGTPLLEFEDGSPALVQTESNRFLWLIPLSDVSGNLAGRVEFVPFMAELLLSDRISGSGDLNSVDFEPGETVYWESPEPIAADTLTLTASGSDEEIAHETESGSRHRAGPLSRPGVYEWAVNQQPVGFTVVNFPTSESDLTSLTLEETRQSASVAVEGGSDVRYLRDGMKLWPWLIAAAVAFLLIEGAVTLWAARTP